MKMLAILSFFLFLSSTTTKAQTDKAALLQGAWGYISAQDTTYAELIIESDSLTEHVEGLSKTRYAYAFRNDSLIYPGGHYRVYVLNPDSMVLLRQGQPYLMRRVYVNTDRDGFLPFFLRKQLFLYNLGYIDDEELMKLFAEPGKADP